MDNLRYQNTKLNDSNFKYEKKIKKLKGKLYYTENIKTIWQIKDKIRELQHKILINQQQVRFNLMVLLKST
jgi:hypothetical protein